MLRDVRSTGHVSGTSHGNGCISSPRMLSGWRDQENLSNTARTCRCEDRGRTLSQAPPLHDRRRHVTIVDETIVLPAKAPRFTHTTLRHMPFCTLPQARTFTFFAERQPAIKRGVHDVGDRLGQTNVVLRTGTGASTMWSQRVAKSYTHDSASTVEHRHSA